MQGECGRTFLHQRRNECSQEMRPDANIKSKHRRRLPRQRAVVRDDSLPAASTIGAEALESTRGAKEWARDREYLGLDDVCASSLEGHGQRHLLVEGQRVRYSDGEGHSITQDFPRANGKRKHLLCGKSAPLEIEGVVVAELHHVGTRSHRGAELLGINRRHTNRHISDRLGKLHQLSITRDVDESCACPRASKRDQDRTALCCRDPRQRDYDGSNQQQVVSIGKVFKTANTLHQISNEDVTSFVGGSHD